MRENSRIIAVKKDKNGKVTHLMMSNGQIYDYPTVIRMAEIGQLENVHVKQNEGDATLFNSNQEAKDLNDYPLFE